MSFICDVGPDFLIEKDCADSCGGCHIVDFGWKNHIHCNAFDSGLLTDNSFLAYGSDCYSNCRRIHNFVDFPGVVG